MVIDSLIRELNGNGYNAKSFAYDLLILLIGLFKNTLSTLKNSVFSIVERWYKLKVTEGKPKKTSLFTNKTKIKPMKLLTKLNS